MKNLMQNQTIKSSIFLFVLIILFFFFCLGVILLIKPFMKEKETNPNDVSFVSDKKNVSISRVIPVSLTFGKSIEEDNAGAFGYLEFDVANHSEENRNFQIIVTKEDDESYSIPSQYVVLYLVDDNNNPLEGYSNEDLPSYSQLHYVPNKADSKILYKGSLNGNETKHLKLRVWISDSYVVQYENESFIFNIDAYAI